MSPNTTEETSNKNRKITGKRLQLTTRMLSGLPKIIENWWDDICLASGIEPSVLDESETVLHIIEIAKNALESGEICTIILNITQQCINITLNDNGPGIDDPIYRIDTSTGGGHGLRRAFNYADLFVIETKNLKYEKINQYLAVTGPSDIQGGTKITFVKSFLQEIDVDHCIRRRESRRMVRIDKEYLKNVAIIKQNTIGEKAKHKKDIKNNRLTNKREGKPKIHRLTPPEETLCRFSYKGSNYTGIIKEGKLFIANYGSFTSFSGASGKITNTSRNGWLDWEMKLPGNVNWQLSDVWRKSIMK